MRFARLASSNRHDILTGSKADGTAYGAGSDFPGTRHLGNLIDLGPSFGGTGGVFRFELPKAGRHEIRWDGRDSSGQALPRGVYTVRLRLLD